MQCAQGRFSTFVQQLQQMTSFVATKLVAATRICIALQVFNSTLEPEASGTLNIFTVVYPGPGFTGNTGYSCKTLPSTCMHAPMHFLCVHAM
jgi:hypothetical protein